MMGLLLHILSFQAHTRTATVLLLSVIDDDFEMLKISSRTVCIIQVLIINGVDVASMAHDQVVRFIRSARETLNGELVLTIRPNGELFIRI